MYHKHGGDIYSYSQIRDFSANINAQGMPESVREAARAAVDASLHYPDPAYRSLRYALAEREGVDDSQIICGNGAAELMFSLAAARRPGSAFLAVPSFFEYEQALTAFGCRIDYFCLRESEGFVLKADFLEAIPEGTEMIILGNPNNPTGRLVSGEILKSLFAICQERHIFLVLDESFFDFLTEEDRGKTLDGVSELREMKNLFLLKSFTKMYGMPGLRFGYGICSDTALLDQMRSMMQPWNVSVPSQMAAEAAADEISFAKKTAADTARNRQEMKRRMEECGYRVYDSNANFLLFQDEIDLSGAGNEAEEKLHGTVRKESMKECQNAGHGRCTLQEFCLQHGFLIRDCSNFPGLSRGYYRICVRGHEENELLLAVLRKAVRR